MVVWSLPEEDGPAVSWPWALLGAALLTLAVVAVALLTTLGWV